LGEGVGADVREGFADRLKLALDEAGYGIHEKKKLGLLFSVTPQAVSKWLTGEAMPSATRAPAIAEKLGVRRAWLLDNELPMRAHAADMAETGLNYAAQEAFSLSGEEFRLLVNFRKLTKPSRNLVEQLVQALAQPQQRKSK
jgi:transcriptional regulator with XRE-family HTH domain